MDGLQFCSRLAAQRPDIPVVVMTAFGSLETAIAAIRAGAYDFVTKPIEMELLAVILHRAVERRRLQEQVRSLAEAVARSSRFEELLGESQSMTRLYDQLSRIADADASVLITGESGTGKELVARALHSRSRRRDRPFIAVNCAALPDTLLESELFGHVKGAFTDARADRKGLFVQAEGGTLLLGRDRRDAARHASQAAASARGEQGPAGRRRARDSLRRPDPRRHESRSRNGRRGKALSPGPLFPRQRHPNRGAGAPRARDRYSSARPAFRRAVRRASEEECAGHLGTGRREAARLCLARQRSRAAQRRRASRRPHAARQAHARRSAGEDPRLPRLRRS